MKAESSVNLPEMDLKVFTWEPTPSLVPCLGKDSIKHFLLSEKSNFIIKNSRLLCLQRRGWPTVTMYWSIMRSQLGKLASLISTIQGFGHLSQSWQHAGCWDESILTESEDGLLRSGGLYLGGQRCHSGSPEQAGANGIPLMAINIKSVI